MTVQFPGSANTYVQSHEASGKMVVDFSRNPNSFPLNKYAQIVPSKLPTGYYLKVTVEEAGRILNTNGSNFAWPDGNDAPTGSNGTESFEFLGYRCERYAPSALLGDMTVSNASWDILAQHAAIKAQQAMTLRTQLAVTELTTSGNYDSSHTSAVASISGNSGTWAASTTARSDIKRSLNYAAELILQDTLAAVSLEDLILVISPNLARKMSESQEIIDYIKGSPDAAAALKGELFGRNAFFGLPERLYGWQVVVENTYKTTSTKGATVAKSAVFPSTSAAFVARPGGLVGVAGAPSFSTLTLFVYDQYEMAVETWDDVNNKRKVLRVVDMVDPVMTAPVSGFLFTSCA